MFEENLQIIAEKFNSGGIFMWIILGTLAAGIAVTVERLIFYYFICKTSSNTLIADISAALNNNDHDTAMQKVKGKSPVHRILQSALFRFREGMSIEEIEEGIEESAVSEIPKLSSRLNYLSLFANIATLLGLLGTISGLQVSFSSLANVEASEKAAMLARGISRAMNTTAFGLIVAVPCMISYTFLTNKQKALVSEIDETTVKLINFLKRKKK
ncbi:MAG: MotA/TolQ/ExbB proton channel family protein [Chitinivibrionales bacterium]